MSKDSTHKNYVRRIEHHVMMRYLDVVSGHDSNIHALLLKKYSLQEMEAEESTQSAKEKRIATYIKFWEGLSQADRLSLAMHDAKLNHITRLIRTIGTTDVVWAHNRIESKTAGSAEFVIRNFRKQEIAAAQVQQFMNENAVAWVSLTGHPTNPTTLEFTMAMTELARVIANPSSLPSDLFSALEKLYQTPIVGDRKTPIEEAHEIINTLDVLYDSALEHRRLFENALQMHGYDREGVHIQKPLLIPCVWTLGDGDGNSSLTAEVLEEGIGLHRTRIAGRYLQTLSDIQKNPIYDERTRTGLKRLRSTFENLKMGEIEKVADAQKMSHAIEDIANGINIYDGGQEAQDLKSSILDLSYLVRCFGLGYGTIDIRHNANDICSSVQGILKVAGIDTKDSEYELDYFQIQLTKWLHDPTAIKKCSNVTPIQLKEAGFETAAWILGRLRVVGRHPDMSEKLIIAETTHAAHVLSALFLMEISGHVTRTPGSRIDITTLSESVADLTSIGNTLETLLENSLYRAHVASRGRIIAMIAKSDTTRQDGRGEAEFAQYEACTDIYRVVEKMRRKYPELQDLRASIMNGGGHALQRGGGRVTEVPAVHGRAAADARVTDIGPSTLTVQGQQLGILFCPGKAAIGTLEALASQNLYSKAGVHGEMPEAYSEAGMNRQYARIDAWLYAKTAGLAFEALAKDNPAIDRLLVRAPWLSMKAGNVSSRPGKRGEKLVGPGITPAEAIGDNPKALQGRAISGERLTAHACLPVFSVLGLVEAMETVRGQGQASRNPEKYGDALHHLYRAHKIHRDSARATINAITMADFDIAWPLLTGQKRPAPKKRAKMADRFQYRDTKGTDTPDITLAFLEQYFLEAEMLSYEMICGQKAKKNFRHGDGLKKLWPELYNEVSKRDRAAEFARVIECHRTAEQLKTPDEPLTETEFRMTQALYAAADVVNAPVGILATRTRLEPVYEVKNGVRTKFMKPESFLEGDVAALLETPPSLR